MPKVINTKNIKLKDNKSTISEFSWETSENLGKDINMNDFSCNIRSLDQGKYSYPYHFHHNAEELFIVLSGNGELRTSEGLQKIVTGDIGLFEKGVNGAHQLYNPNKEPLVYLDLRTLKNIDVCEYPDSNKVNILPSQDIFIKGDNAEYFHNENNIQKVWRNLKLS